MNKPTKKDKLTVLYERLFHDDERAGESVSIEKFFTTKMTKSVLSIVKAVYLQNDREVNTHYG